MNYKQTKFKETELGLIPEDWKVFKLDDLGTFRGGVTSIKRDDYGFGTPFITYKNIFKNSRIKIDQLELMNVPEKDIDRFDCKFGDIFFTASSETYDEIAMSSVLLETVDKLTFNGFSKRLRLYDFSKLLPEYARYVLRSRIFRNQVEEKVTGDVRFNASQEMLGSIKMPLPPLPEQQKIAEVLGALDQKIELNRKMNKTLESLAQAVFKKWFIDDANPNWETKKLGDVVRIKYGKNLPTTKLQESGYPVFGGNGQIGFFDKYLYELPQVLVACRGAASGKVNFSLPKSFVTNNSLILEYDNILNYEFLKYFALNADFYSCVSGSAQPQITIESLDGYEIMMPSKEIIYKFGQVAEPITQKILLNDNEINTLSQIRDSLLPRLMSGKLRVK